MPTKSKGVRAYNKYLTAILAIDKLSGISYGELSRRYKLDKSNIRRRIAGLSELVDVMDLEFKRKLLALYPQFDRVTGPYLRKDGRKHIVLNDTALPNKTKGKLKTISWPKALIEVKIGRILLDGETVDHEDEDYTNDLIDNLQILSRKENIIKSFELNPERAKEWYVGNCPICNEKFAKPMHIVKHNQFQGKAGPFCSKKCAGKYGKEVQIVRVAQRQRQEI